MNTSFHTTLAQAYSVRLQQHGTQSVASAVLKKRSGASMIESSHGSSARGAGLVLSTVPAFMNPQNVWKLSGLQRVPALSCFPRSALIPEVGVPDVAELALLIDEYGPWSPERPFTF